MILVVSLLVIRESPEMWSLIVIPVLLISKIKSAKSTDDFLFIFLSNSERQSLFDSFKSPFGKSVSGDMIFLNLLC